MARTPRNGRWLIAILALAAVLRLVHLGTYPYWHDEVHNLIKSDHLAEVLTEGSFVSNHPPLFTVLLAGWRAIGMGASEWTMRGLPALLGVMVSAAAYWTGTRLFNARTGLMSAFLVAVSPFFIVHSQDVKEYILLALTGTLLVWVMYEAANRNKAGWWIAYALAAALACYSDVYAAPLLLGLNIWFLLHLPGRTNRLPGWALANLAGAALFVPYLGVLLRRADLMLVQSEQWWLQKPTIWDAVFLLKTMAFGYEDSDPLFKIALGLYCFAAAAGALLAFGHGWRAALLVSCWFVIPIGVMFVGSQFVNSFFLIRAMLPFAVPFYILAAVFLARFEHKMLRGAAAAAFGALAVIPIWHYYTRDLPAEELPHRPGIHAPFASKEAARYIAANFRNGDVIAHTSAPTWLPFYWYGLREYPQVQVAVDGEHIAMVNAMGPSTTTSKEFEGYFSHDVREATASAKRVWLVFSDWERAYLNGSPMQVWRWMSTNFAERETFDFAGLDVRLYENVETAGPLVVRDRDDGIAADMQWGADETSRRVAAPDAGLVERTVADRAGALTLSFETEPAARVHSIAFTEDRRRVSFALANASPQTRRVSVHALASDALLTAASFTRADERSIAWRTAAQHNPSGSPPHYELNAAVARFVEPGPATLLQRITLPSGLYDTCVYAIATPADPAHARAQLSVFADDRDILARTPRNRADLFGWRWMRGEAFSTSGDEFPVRVLADHLLGLAESYADVLYVAFVRRRGAPRAQPAAPFIDSWPGELSIAPGGRLSWTMEIDADVKRVDVWVHELEADGRVYHILDERPLRD